MKLTAFRLALVSIRSEITILGTRVDTLIEQVDEAIAGQLGFDRFMVKDSVADADGRVGRVVESWSEAGIPYVRVEYSNGGSREAPATNFTLAARGRSA